jgi:hypothetical protein
VFDNTIDLRDIDDEVFYYKSTILLCISAYSDSVTLVNKEFDQYMQLLSDLFDQQI